MLLEVILLVCTLLIALLGVTTPISDTVAGKAIIVVLLVVSTVATLLLKREEHRRHLSMQRRLQQLTDSAQPSDAMIEDLSRAVNDVRRARGMSLANTRHVMRHDDETLVIWAWPDSAGIPAEVLVVAAKDINEMALLDGRALRRAVDNLVAGRWGHDSLVHDSDLIAHRVLTTVIAWIDHLDLGLLGYSSSSTTDPKSGLTRVSFVPVDDDGDAIEEFRIDLDRAELDHLLTLPVLDRGRALVVRVVEWVDAVEAAQSRESDSAGLSSTVTP
jgi:hypothetical protein